MGNGAQNETKLFPENISSGPGTHNLDSDMELDNEKENSAQEPEEENLDLVMENDDWATSPNSSLSPDEEKENPDSANSW